MVGVAAIDINSYCRLQRRHPGRGHGATLMTLMFDLPPENRGLQISEETAVWSFPDNYVQALTEDINTYVNPR